MTGLRASLPKSNINLLLSCALCLTAVCNTTLLLVRENRAWPLVMLRRSPAQAGHVADGQRLGAAIMPDLSSFYASPFPYICSTLRSRPTCAATSPTLFMMVGQPSALPVDCAVHCGWLRSRARACLPLDWPRSAPLSSSAVWVPWVTAGSLALVLALLSSIRVVQATVSPTGRATGFDAAEPS